MAKIRPEDRAQYERDIRHATAIIVPPFVVLVIIIAAFGWPF